MSEEKKQKPEKPRRAAERLYGREIISLLFLGLSLFFALAIVSYHPADPAFFAWAGAVHNWCGLTGAFLAYIFRAGFGLAAYLLPATFLCLAGLAWFERKTGLNLARSAAALAFLLAGAAFVSLTGYFGPEVKDSGGAVGAYLGQRVQLFAGRGGGLVLLSCFLAVSFIFATRISLARLASWAWPLLWRVSTAALAAATAAGLWLREKWGRLYSALGLDRRTLAEGYEEIERSGEKLIKTRKPRHPAKPAEEKEAAPDTTAPPPAPRKKGKYQLPPLSLLNDPPESEVEINQQELLENAKSLENKLKDFGVFGRVAEIHPGPVITMYEFEPAPGIKVNRIVALSDDLAMAMRAVSVRIVAPIPGKAAVGIEIPNKHRQTVFLKEILTSDDFQSGGSLLHLCLGKDIAGHPVVTDLKKMPHLLVAGATGSGKSVAVNSMITSILYRATPDQVKFIMVDPKLLELSLYDHIPHLLLPVVTNPRKAAAALRWGVLEMERRYRLLADLGVRDIDNYNKKVPPAPPAKAPPEKKEEAALAPAGAVLSVPPATPPEKEEHQGPLPHIVIVIDELADLMMVSTKEVEDSLTRLAQMARAAGLHLILATQRPSVDVITGIIKANFSTRISFQVSSRVDSRTVLDTIGAERLLGRGDMLFLPPGTSKLQRIHGCFISDGEIRKVCDFLKAQEAPVYDEEILRVQELKKDEEEADELEDEMYDRALAIVSESRIASISMIQRKLRIGYNRAARMIERMEKEGVVSRGDPGKPREVLMRHADYE